MSREGSLDAPTRHPIAWRDPAFYDADQIDAEMRRVFDICHGCRRCFNLCDSFPRLFDLIDNSETGELDAVSSDAFPSVVEACTLCDMCFMTKCPYVPPHEFNLDFPHLMLRYRAAEVKAGKTDFTTRQLAEMDRNGRIGTLAAPLVNWASDKDNRLARKALSATAGIDRDANLPKFHHRTFLGADRRTPVSANPAAPAFGKRKAALYATCFVNYNRPDTGMDARAVLNHLGVETKACYPGCCGMPFLEQAELDRVARQAESVAKELCKLIDAGYDIVTLTASCGLMLKFEWPLILPENADVRRLSEHTFDIDEYVVDVARTFGLPDGLKPLPEGISVHLPCHARAQNMGPKAAEMLKLIPDTPVDVIERCSGHGGTFGVMRQTHATAVKVGRPVFRTVVSQARGHVASDCPLAALHIVNEARTLAAREGKSFAPKEAEHPVQIFARALGLKGDTP
ncbi:MAG: glycerol-3-phosphate dehydrogenase [Alphaproteobacteria bacterium]|nr:glycerol-3-phosphate dehydrogenase [Alphaproteobacteria bacterium]